MILRDFSASFFRFFQNVENAPDITFSNSLAALRPSKTIDFWIDFSLNLHVFSDPLPKSIFRWSKRQPILKSAVLGRFWDPRKTENRSKTKLLRIGWHFGHRKIVFGRGSEKTCKFNEKSNPKSMVFECLKKAKLLENVVSGAFSSFWKKSKK